MSERDWMDTRGARRNDSGYVIEIWIPLDVLFSAVAAGRIRIVESSETITDPEAGER